MKTLLRDDLELGGFAGLVEHRLVCDARLFGPSDRLWPRAIGNFVYLADARFQPHGETGLHPHREIDILSFMIEGRIHHQGSMGEGTQLSQYDVQIQRAGARGLLHNEVNPDPVENRMLQLWLLPDAPGGATEYQVVQPRRGTVTRIYGGDGREGRIAARTRVDVALLESVEEIEQPGEFVAYLVEGEGHLNHCQVQEGALIKGDGLQFQATVPSYLLIVSLQP